MTNVVHRFSSLPAQVAQALRDRIEARAWKRMAARRTGPDGDPAGQPQDRAQGPRPVAPRRRG
ncbi:MAG: hypothetical protein WDM96_11475 [Lacunisphaera sp.]